LPRRAQAGAALGGGRGTTYEVGALIGEVDVRVGSVKWFNEIRGRGVIRGLEGGDFPVHFREILDDGFRTLSEGETVEFEVASGCRGSEAVSVRRRNESLTRGSTMIPEAREKRQEAVDRNCDKRGEKHVMGGTPGDRCLKA